MNYELAKILKDAGFPQKREWDDHFCKHGLGGDICTRCKADEFYAHPNLEELIEACGEGIRVIIWFTPSEYGDWHAGIIGEHMSSELYVDDYPNPNEHGKTVTEAVSSLWLKLNE